MTSDEDVATVRALAAGELASWHGLPAGLDRAALDAALGPGGEELPGALGGPAMHRTHPPAAGAPFGVKAWLVGELVGALEIREPPLSSAVEAQLGAADATAPSGLGPSYRQDVYAARGLALHVGRESGAVRRLYAFRPMDADEFLAGPIGQVEERRIPLD